MENPLPSPRITKIAWGHVEVEGFGEFKDVKLFPGGAREWNWQETGTEHTPGVQFSDVEELLDNGAEVVVFSQGVYARLKVQGETLKKLKAMGIETHVSKTGEAVEIYDKLREDKLVGGLFHSTC